MTLRRMLLLWQVPVWVLLLMAYSFVNHVLNERFRSTARTIQTREQVLQLNQVMQNVVDMETGVRGYIIVGRPEFLESYSQGKTSLPYALTKLHNTTNQASDPVEASQQLQQLENLIQRWQTEVAEPEIAARREGQLEQARLLVANGHGKELVSEMRNVIRSYGERESKYLAQQEALGEAQLRSLQLSLVGVALLLLLVNVGFVLLASERLERGFKAVMDAAGRLGAGQRGVRLQADGAQEFHQVSETFNRMSTELEQAQAEALSRTQALTRRNTQMRALGELSDWLQATRTLEEGGEVLARAMPNILPGTAGVLLLHSAQRNLLLPLVSWGWPPDADASGHPSEQCWALRRGEARFPGEGRFAPPCLAGTMDAVELRACTTDELASGDQKHDYLCFPLFSHGETLGILRLYALQQDCIVNDRDELRQLLVPLSRQLGLALASLQLQDRLLQQSLRDPLTGIANRRHLEQELDIQSLLAESKGQPLSLIVLDVDHFKRLNDSFGHDAGDAVLVRLGQALQEIVPPGALAARPGGEEFALLLPGYTAEEAAQLAERIRIEIASWTLSHGGILLGKITVSQGVATWGGHVQSPSTLVKEADKALYISKAEGRDRVTVAEPQEQDLCVSDVSSV